jgi:acyl transferase domain-containing protein
MRGLMSDEESLQDSLDIAVVGMAGRFPGAATVSEFWRGLRSGRCAISYFNSADHPTGSTPLAGRPDEPRLVRAGYVLEGAEQFDAQFFGYSPRAAELMDPQQRVLLECAWTALESAGYDTQRYEGAVGVYAGAGHNTYLLVNVGSRPDLGSAVADKQVLIGNRSDFLTGRISHKLGLRGPSVNVQTACSTSLVAIAEACQALLAFQCDMAVAGGVAVDLTRRRGYQYHPEGLLSPDGYCRTFDAQAGGTAAGEGVGVVVLKRLDDALTDRDHIHAVVKGAAVNNDGARRAGFGTPSAPAQAACIRAALDNAGVAPETIQYVEAHGTGTAIGDLVEVSALDAVYGGTSAGTCYLGSVKTNIGHLDAAAGVAGFIKTVLALEHHEIPPSLHFTEPNRLLRQEGSPFRVATTLTEWPGQRRPHRAAVSSFGLGGTNAHVLLEQAPELSRADPPDREQLLVLSARTPKALEEVTDRLEEHLRDHPELALADVAFTLQHGRRRLPNRRVLIARHTPEALNALRMRDDGRMLTALVEDIAQRPVAFMFSGFGDQYPGMAAGLYEDQPVFRDAVDTCVELLAPLLDENITTYAFTRQPASSTEDGGPRPDSYLQRLMAPPERGPHPLDRPSLGYPAVFVLEYALAELWACWGVQPEAMIGHSLGEYVAACAASVFSLPDALRLVVERARLIEERGAGAMVAVPLTEREAARHVTDEVCIAAVNDPHTCVLSGTVTGIERVLRDLARQGTVFRRLKTEYAFHSPLMDPVVEPYTELVRNVRLDPPKVPFVSNLTGTWINEEEATRPDYWARQLREPVRYADGIGELWSLPDVALLEIGPGQSLVTAALHHPGATASTGRPAVPSLPGACDDATDRAALLRAAGQLWLAGVNVGLPPEGEARRVPLPGYPFDRQRFLIEPGARSTGSGRVASRDSADPAQWCYSPTWRRLPAAAVDADLAGGWLMFADSAGVAERLAAQVRERGGQVVTVVAGASWTEQPDRGFVVDPGNREHYRELAQILRARGCLPDRVVHCWGVGTDGGDADDATGYAHLLERGFGSLTGWALAAGTELMTGRQEWFVVTSGACSVLGDEPLCPPKAAVRGLCAVLRQEYPGLSVTHADLAAGDIGRDPSAAADRLLDTLAGHPCEYTVALRGRHRWAPAYQVIPLPARPCTTIRAGSTYLITGGLGRIGLLAARVLAERAAVNLVLLSRTWFPPQEQWDDPSLGPEAARGVRAVRDLERLGARVLVVAADVADAERMREVKRMTLASFGAICGLLHCAGVTGDEAHRAVADLDAGHTAAHFNAKVHGPRILAEILSDQPLEFAILCSSVAAVVGGLGYAAYAAANSVLDAFALRRGGVWTSVNWEAWDFQDGAALPAAVRELALAPTEGRLLLDQLVDAVPQPQLVVSTTDVDRRQAWWADAVNAPLPRQRYERPRLRNPYVQPETPTEHRIAEVWQELLGVDQIGANDSFFELGGSSLLGLKVVHRFRQEMALAMPLHAIYEGPTVRSLARIVDQLRGSQR